jgi:hypothetical protein
VRAKEQESETIGREKESTTIKIAAVRAPKRFHRFEHLNVWACVRVASPVQNAVMRITKTHTAEFERFLTDHLDK